MKKVLILGGGGLNGIYALYTLNHIYKINNTVPTFDLLSGTSSGSFIAALLATKTLLDFEKFDESITDIIEKTFLIQSDMRYFYFFRTKFQGGKKSSVLRQIFGEKTLGEVETRLAIMAYDTRGVHRAFCSWKKEDKDLYIWQLVDASSALPGYFPPVKIGDRIFVDGGVYTSNPISTTYVICKELFSRFKILNITMGNYNHDIHVGDPHFTGPFFWMWNNIISWLMSDDTDMLAILKDAIGSENILQLEYTPKYNVMDTRIFSEKSAICEETQQKVGRAREDLQLFFKTRFSCKNAEY